MGLIRGLVHVPHFLSILSKSSSAYAGPIPMHCTRCIYQPLDVLPMRW